MKSIECWTIRDIYKHLIELKIIIIHKYSWERKVYVFTEGEENALHIVRVICVGVLNVSSISKSFIFWYIVYTLFPWGGQSSCFLLLQGRHRVYVEPVSMCMSADGNAVYVWIDVLVGLGIFVVIKAEMY